jgi:hypothetical protein
LRTTGRAFLSRQRVAEVSIPARPGLEPELLAGAQPRYQYRGLSQSPLLFVSDSLA